MIRLLLSTSLVVSGCVGTGAVRRAYLADRVAELVSPERSVRQGALEELVDAGPDAVGPLADFLASAPREPASEDVEAAAARLRRRAEGTEPTALAACALARIGTPALGALLPLVDGDHVVRSRALEALGLMGRRARALVPDLVLLQNRIGPEGAAEVRAAIAAMQSAERPPTRCPAESRIAQAVALVGAALEKDDRFELPPDDPDLAGGPGERTTLSRAVDFVSAGLAWLGLSEQAEAVETMAPCPDGAKTHGASPPEGRELACVTDDDVRHGTFRSWHENGARAEVSEWWKGRRWGEHRVYYDNGQLAERGAYLGDRRHGPWTRWHKAGQKIEEGYYFKGQPVGDWILWRDNGHREAAGPYRAGARDGAWTFYDDEGRAVRRVPFTAGRSH